MEFFPGFVCFNSHIIIIKRQRDMNQSGCLSQRRSTPTVKNKQANMNVKRLLRRSGINYIANRCRVFVVMSELFTMSGMWSMYKFRYNLNLSREKTNDRTIWKVLRWDLGLHHFECRRKPYYVANERVIFRDKHMRRQHFSTLLRTKFRYKTSPSQ